MVSESKTLGLKYKHEVGIIVQARYNSCYDVSLTYLVRAG